MILYSLLPHYCYTLHICTNIEKTTTLLSTSYNRYEEVKTLTL